MPSTLAENPGRILEIRFDGAPLSYSQWCDATFTDPAERENPETCGPLASPFGDAVANLLRFALGTNPAGRVPLPEIIASDGAPRFCFPYNPGLYDLRWRVEATRDPADWSAAEVLFDSRHDGVLPDAAGWLEIEDKDSGSARFYRLRLESGE